jgi:hypothetical protein
MRTDSTSSVTMLVIIRAPSSRSTTATTYGASALKAGPAGRRAMVKL